MSPFARLSFAEKAGVIQIMDINDSFMALWPGVLPGLVGCFRRTRKRACSIHRRAR